MTITALRSLPLPRSVDDLLWDARATLIRLTPAQVRARRPLLIDIRPHAQRAASGEVPGALVLERTDLEWRLDPQSSAHFPETGYDVEIVVLDADGRSSSLAAAALQQLGLSRATDVIGGFEAWAHSGLPTVPGGTPAGQRTGTPQLVELQRDIWEVRVAGEAIHLTRQEFRILAALFEARGRVIPRAVLGDLVEAYPSTTRALDVHVCRIRAKLGPAADLLVTVRGVGWRLLPNP